LFSELHVTAFWPILYTYCHVLHASSAFGVEKKQIYFTLLVASVIFNSFLP